ncbi:MAG: lipid-A-disaccharide synthase, partial [Gammaproteobacteria bacterium]
VTLEAALTKTPLVVAYQMPRLTYTVLRRLVKIPWIALPNILLGRDLAPEFLQSAATPDALGHQLVRWLTAADAARAYQEACLDLHRTLRNNAGEAAAAVVLEWFERRMRLGLE